MTTRQRWLNIGAGLRLPIEAVTQTFSILAKRGMGKTYTAMVMAEEMLGVGAQIVVIDPVGVWWGLRSNASGKGDGLPITILGGEHGDAPLEVTSGKVIANMVVAENFSVVLDLSLLRKNEMTRFMIGFAEQLYHKNRKPLHILMDEADAFAPQRTIGPDKARLLGAVEDLVRRGRARGIGVTLISQRPAVLNKNVLTQTEVLITMRMTAPQDRKALDDWVEQHGDRDQRTALLAELSALPVGTAWFWSPGWLDVFKKVKVRKRRTFDSSATPELDGKATTMPDRTAKVDLERLRKHLAAAFKLAEATDPKVQGRRIVELERQLRKAGDAVQKVADPVQVEVPIVLEKDLKVATDLAIRVRQDLRRLQDAFEVVGKKIAGAALRSPGGVAHRVSGSGLPENIGTFTPAKNPAAVNGDLSKPQRLVLTALAQHPNGRTAEQLGVLAGYSCKGGAFRRAMKLLREAGHITDGMPAQITDAGVEILGPYDPLPTGAALADYWVRTLPTAAGKILRHLVDEYPAEMDAQTIARHNQYSHLGGAFRSALKRLRTLELVTGTQSIRASTIFFEPGP